MLKKDVPYFFGRSFDMLKYKKFFDKEFKIVDFEEGNGNLVGIAAAVICETEDGQTFKAGVMGTQDYARDLFSFKDLYKGKMATIVYQALTPLKDGKGGVPRFGKMREIRNYE
jgi:ATP-dependent DNA ligase